MNKIMKPINLLYFIIIPQIILGLYLVFAFADVGENPRILMIIAAAAQAILDVAVLVYFLRSRKAEQISARFLRICLIGFIAVFTAMIILLLRQFDSYGFGVGLSSFGSESGNGVRSGSGRVFGGFGNPETIYLLLHSITLIYLALANIKSTLEASGEKTKISYRIAICFVLPIAAFILLNNSLSYNDLMLVAAVGMFCIFAYYLAFIFYYFFRKVIAKNAGSDIQDLENKKYSTAYLTFIIVAAIILPLLGLFLNNSLDDFEFGGKGIFGNFQSVWFYIIALMNGALMTVKIRANRTGMLLFYLKMIGITYIAYFTVVFLPITPFGVIGLAFAGLGILIFVPAIVLIAEILQLTRSLKVLRKGFNRASIIAVMVAGVLTLPALLCADFYIDRLNFRNATAYMSGSSGVEQPYVNIRRLKRPIENMKVELENTSTNGFLFNGRKTPIISQLYLEVALDGKVLSDESVKKLEKIFFGENTQQIDNFVEPQNINVEVVNATTDTKLDKKSGVYLTWVDLEIKNNSGVPNSEFYAEFDLPEGCFIKDYYLYVGNVKKHGILSDKRPALFTYNSIVRTRKDPGIMYFEDFDTVVLRVFPFSQGEVRRTGFLVMHSQTETIELNGREIILKAEQPIDEPLQIGGICFIPAAYKEKLNGVEFGQDRIPQYCFVIDGGIRSPYEEHVRKVKDYMEANEITDAKYYVASYKVEELQLSELESYSAKAEGGFNLSLAADVISRGSEEGTFPIIIAVTDNMGKATKPELNTRSGKFAESRYYYNLNYDLTLAPYSLNEGERLDDRDAPIIVKAMEYNGMTISDDGRSEIIYTDEGAEAGEGGLNASAADTENSSRYKPYLDCFLLQKRVAGTNSNEEQIDLIREAFRKKLLTEYTSFIVLETEEQEASLLDLQDRFMSGEITDAPAVMMSEPGWLYCLAILAVLMFIIRRRRTRTTT